jgi:DNA-binding transcriptional MocR family regulator
MRSQNAAVTYQCARSSTTARAATAAKSITPTASREFPETASWSHPQGGYFLWVDLPPDVRADDLQVAAEAVGVTFVKGSDFFAGHLGGEHELRLAYSFVSPEQIADGVARLAPLLRGATAPAATAL